MTAVVATRTCFGRKPGEDCFPVIVEIGTPYKCKGDPETWACPVRIEPFLDGVRDAYGVDSLQALCMAVYLVRKLLDGFCAEGGMLSCGHGDEFSNSPNLGSA